MDDLIKQSRTIPTFRGTQKIRQFVLFNNTLQCRSISCIDCDEDCTHYNLGYFQQHRSNKFTKKRSKSPQKSMESNIMKDNHQLSLASSLHIQDHTELFIENTIDLEDEGSTVISDSGNIAAYGDYVLVKWGTAKYPGEVLFIFEDGLMVRCMKQGLKFWRWPNIKDEQLYKWEDVIQKIKTPKLDKRGNYVIAELDGLYK